MGEQEEKEVYRELIIALVNKIDRLDVLKYFYYFINGKMKAEQ